MAIGLVGKKCGMTRVFTPEGASLPVTVVHVEPNRVVQIKTNATDGYCSVQVTTGQRKTSKLSRPMSGHYAKNNVAPGRGLWEFDVAESEINKDTFKPGSEFTVDLFSEGQWVDVAGTTRGKGFAGVIKKYHFHMQDATHGNSLLHRAPGSIGQRQTPGRVPKGKKMCGHLGDARRTIQNQKIIKIDKDKQLILIQGAVPGAPDGTVFILPSIKKPHKSKE
ncbi:MAG: 50S ribosomal protein L3 [Gammaproteobacteria bacterium RIFCSPLOWO2_02_FULL_42_9]|nr:MAG: 50S ribosomal protein L3 [Gammaproteobacteria bacterium RIFCSPLOWO2_02_FULL_42_9]